jgi:hypothetical protein
MFLLSRLEITHVYIRLSKISVTNFQPEKANDPSNLSATFSVYTKNQECFGTPDLILHYFDPLNILNCLNWNGPSIQSVNVQPDGDDSGYYWVVQWYTDNHCGTQTNTNFNGRKQQCAPVGTSYPVQSIYAYIPDKQ